MTKTEIARESLEIMESIASYFYSEDIMLRFEKRDRRNQISKLCTDFVVKLKGELK